MSLDFDVRRPTRHCALGDRPLLPGEPYVSVLIDTDKEVLRQDIAASSWDGPPEGTIGWWRTRMPGGNGTPKAAPREVMLGLMDQWAEQPDEAAARYILALLLIRRRVLRIEAGGFASGLQAEKEASQDQDVLRLSCVDRDEPFLVTVATPTSEEIVTIEQRLAELLGMKPRGQSSPHGKRAA